MFEILSQLIGENGILMLCLILALPLGMLFLYMFDDKADHGKFGFDKYIINSILKSLKEIFLGKEKEELCQNEQKMENGDGETSQEIPKENS